MSWIEAELDKKITVNYSWRAKPAWEPTTTLIVASLIPDGKKLGLSQRGTVPTNNSVLTVCKNLRKLFKRLQDNLNQEVDDEVEGENYRNINL